MLQDNIIFNYISVVLETLLYFPRDAVNLFAAERQDWQKQISHVSPSTVRGSGNSLDYHSVLLVCKRGRQVTGQNRREITRECKLTLIPSDSFCTYAREPSNSSLCGRPLSTLIWIHVANNEPRSIAPASCFVFYLDVSSRYVDGEGPRGPFPVFCLL